MSDLISRQAAMKLLKADADACASREDYEAAEICERHYIRISNLPSAQPERKKGKWIVTSEFEDCRYAKCNQCKVTQIFYYNKPLTNFCPNCGADMRVDKNERH